MYRAPSKQRQRIVRVLVYGAMTATVLLLVTTLVFVMLGYRFNRATSTIEQGGLVQFNTRPVDANVTVGKAKLTDRTPSKITINPGDYNVTMEKKGYHTWSKSVEVEAGRVLWLNYAQLVPTSIDTKQVMVLDAVSDVLASPNGDRFAVLTSATEPKIEFIDIISDKPKQTLITLPQESLLGDANSLSLETWGSDSDRLLLTAKSDTAAQWLVADRRDEAKTVNISAKYGVDISEAVFDPRSNNRIIIRTIAGDVRIIDVSNDTISGVVASSVSHMATFMDDAILVVQQTSDTTQSVGYVSFGSTSVRQLQQVDTSDKISVAGATYFGDPYITIASGSKLDVYKLRALPSSESDTSISMTNLLSTSLSANPEHLSIKTGGRFVLAQYSSGLLTYDIELKKQSNISFSVPVTEELRWLDKYHFYLTGGSSLEVLEFDGGNAHIITPLTTAFDSVWRDNGKYIYSFTAKEGKFVLQRSQMILDQ